MRAPFIPGEALALVAPCLTPNHAPSHSTAYYRGAMGILLVYDVTDESSFSNIRNWMRNIEAHASEHVVKALVGNKSDMDESRRVVPYTRGQVRRGGDGGGWEGRAVKACLGIGCRC